MLHETSGEPVETVLKRLWPTAGFPDLLDTWIVEYEPDIVCFCVSSFWVEAELVRFGLERRLGPLGRPLGRIAAAVARTPSVVRTPLVQAGRRLALRPFGGATTFRPAQVVDVFDAAIRRALRHEHIGATVVATPFSPMVGAGPRARRRTAQRRAELYRGIRAICEPLHIHCELPELTDDSFSRRFRGPDGLHFGAEAHAICGEIEGRALVTAWKQLQSGGT